MLLTNLKNTLFKSKPTAQKGKQKARLISMGLDRFFPPAASLHPAVCRTDLSLWSVRCYTTEDRANHKSAAAHRCTQVATLKNDSQRDVSLHGLVTPKSDHTSELRITPGGGTFWAEVPRPSCSSQEQDGLLHALRISRLSAGVCLAIISQLALIGWWFVTDLCELFAEPTAGAFTQLLVTYPLLPLLFPLAALLLSEVDGLRKLSEYNSGRPRADFLVKSTAPLVKAVIFLWVGLFSVNPARLFQRWQENAALWESATATFTDDCILRAGSWGIRRKANTDEILRLVELRVKSWAGNSPQKIAEVNEYLAPLTDSVIAAYSEKLTTGALKLDELLSQFRPTMPLEALNVKVVPLERRPAAGYWDAIRTAVTGACDFIVAHPVEIGGTVLALVIAGILDRRRRNDKDAQDKLDNALLPSPEPTAANAERIRLQTEDLAKKQGYIDRLLRGRPLHGKDKDPALSKELHARVPDSEENFAAAGPVLRDGEVGAIPNPQWAAAAQRITSLNKSEAGKYWKKIAKEARSQKDKKDEQAFFTRREAEKQKLDATFDVVLGRVKTGQADGSSASSNAAHVIAPLNNGQAASSSSGFSVSSMLSSLSTAPSRSHTGTPQAEYNAPRPLVSASQLESAYGPQQSPAMLIQLSQGEVHVRLGSNTDLQITSGPAGARLTLTAEDPLSTLEQIFKGRN